jgi:hypothetical protein
MLVVVVGLCIQTAAARTFAAVVLNIVVEVVVIHTVGQAGCSTLHGVGLMRLMDSGETVVAGILPAVADTLGHGSD